MPTTLPPATVARAARAAADLIDTRGWTIQQMFDPATGAHCTEGALMAVTRTDRALNATEDALATWLLATQRVRPMNADPSKVVAEWNDTRPTKADVVNGLRAFADSREAAA